MKKYHPAVIEKKWQKKWEKEGVYRHYERDKTMYVLDMFPYPSGAALHVGHPKGYIATDVFSRLKQLQGYGVLHPMGWDAFGLPAEQHAIKNKVHPEKSVKENIKHFKKQLQSIGFTYDWEREINTTDPEYYQWTQWIFLQLFKKGLAYQSFELINWCPGCQTGLANEDLENGRCERCGSIVEKRPMRQWVLRMTEYADRLLYDLDPPAGGEKLNWPESIKEQQRNWIGRSEGTVVDFLVPKVSEILLASNNESKLRRVERLLKAAGLTIKIHTPKSLGLTGKAIREEGGLRENALEKAEAYRGVTQLPILGGDTGFFIEGEDIDPTRPKRNALDGADEKNLSQKEIAEKMRAYYQSIAKKNGGRVPAYWSDEWAFLLSDGTVQHAGARREVILTDQVQGEFDEFLPVRQLYVSKVTGKSVQLQTEEEEMQELQPLLQSMVDLLAVRLPIFTTRLDTIYGCTYVVAAPEHPIISNIKYQISNKEEVEAYLEKAKNKTELERTDLAKEKTGVELKGVFAINPATKEKIPLWIADFVLGSYGTGAVFADAHDQRDFDMAKKYGIPLKASIKPFDNEELWHKIERLEECFEGEGVLVHSAQFDGLSSSDARTKILDWLSKQGLGEKKVNYKMRDWVFSRQRYWGEPIPIIHCDSPAGGCGIVPVPEKDLPVKLPHVASYEPTGTGESPLADIDSWVNVKCPVCKGPAKRETNTMPQWAGSSWYYLRFIDPKNSQVLVDTEKEKAWMPVDVYVGGTEHATRHLLYARFWHKFLFDIGAVSTQEPFTRLVNQGLILASDGRKMSKRWGNVINPDEMVAEFGADAFRLYEMFMGPFGQAIAWNTDGVVGTRRFLEKVWKLSSRIDTNVGRRDTNKSLESLLHRTVKKVTEDIEGFKFNTAVSALMILVNAFEREEKLEAQSYKLLLLLLSPFAPHIVEELWEALGEKNSIFLSSWPTYDSQKIEEEIREIVVQINGKVRDRFTGSADWSEEELQKTALSLPKIQELTKGKEVRKVIVVSGKVVNIVL